MAYEQIFKIDREDAKKAEEEERDIFLRSILEALGLEIGEIWPDIHLSREQKILLRKFLSQYNTEIVDDYDRGYKIYVNDKVIAEWYKPHFVLKKDLQAKTKSKMFYFDMHTKFWSVFHDEDQKEISEDESE